MMRLERLRCCARSCWRKWRARIARRRRIRRRARSTCDDCGGPLRRCCLAVGCGRGARFRFSSGLSWWAGARRPFCLCGGGLETGMECRRPELATNPRNFPDGRWCRNERISERWAHFCRGFLTYQRGSRFVYTSIVMRQWVGFILRSGRGQVEPASFAEKSMWWERLRTTTGSPSGD